MGTVGVFIRGDQRGKGLAHATLENLLANLVLTECSPKPEYLFYQEGMDNLFAQTIEKHGFRPLEKYKKEYRERELRAQGIIPEKVAEVVRYYC